MFSYYTPVLFLQAFCLYHAYKNNTAQKWFWIIVFLPIIGSLIYLYDNFYSQRNVKNLAEGVKEVVVSNYKIDKLEKELRLSDNVYNKTNLADEYVKHGRYQDAITLYNDCLKGFMADDPDLQMKLLQTYFMDGDYSNAITVGNKLGSEKTFKNSETRMAYAWALHYQGDNLAAEKVFTDMDKSYTNYPQRVEYCKFLLKLDKTEDVVNKLSELLEEFEHMKDTERKLKRDLIREVKELHKNVSAVKK